MSSLCAKLQANHNLAMCGQFNAGIEADLFLIDVRDIESRTLAGDVLTGLTLKSGSYAVRYRGKRNAYDASFAMKDGQFVNGFVHNVTCRTFVKSQDLKDAMNTLQYSRVLVVVKNKDRHHEDMLYEVYGSTNGLQMSEIDYTGNEQDGWLASFTLSSTDEAAESQAPVTFYNTDEQTTFLLLLALTQLEWFTLNISKLNSNMKLG